VIHVDVAVPFRFCFASPPIDATCTQRVIGCVSRSLMPVSAAAAAAFGFRELNLVLVMSNLFGG
jgi:hypothetical protein